MQRWVVRVLACIVAVAAVAGGAACSSSSSPDSGATNTAASGTNATSSASGATVAATATTAATAPAASGPLTDACALLTDAQVTAAVGVTMGPGEPPGAGEHSCLWTDQDVVYSAELSIVDAGAFNSGMTGSTQGVTVTKVSGVGESAYYLDAGVAGLSLFFSKGSNYFSIHVQAGLVSDKLSRDQEQAMEKMLALEVLANV